MKGRKEFKNFLIIRKHQRENCNRYLKKTFLSSQRQEELTLNYSGQRNECEENSKNIEKIFQTTNTIKS